MLDIQEYTFPITIEGFAQIRVQVPHTGFKVSRDLAGIASNCRPHIFIHQGSRLLIQYLIDNS